MNDSIHEKAARTAVDAFIAVVRLYRHSYQTITAIKEKIKSEYNLKAESALFNNYQSSADPESWIYHFRGIFLSERKITLEDYKKGPRGVLFLQSSLYNPNRQEPMFRYGVIEKIFNMSTWKGARFEEYVKMVLIELHNESRTGSLKTNYLEATTQFDEKPLLAIRQDKDIIDIAEEIGNKYINKILK